MVRDLYRALSVFWTPSVALSEALTRPFILAPILIPTAFAALTSVTVYAKFPPGDPGLRGLWLIGLIGSIFGPAIVIFVVSGLFFPIFKLAGKTRGYRRFLSVTAVAFVPSGVYHLTQSLGLMASGADALSSQQLARLSLARFLDPDAVSTRFLVASSMIDAVSIWIMVLLVMGYALTMEARSPRRSAVLVVGTWLLYVAIRIVLADRTLF